ncbi:TetR family transcriptional regulator [Tamaricihabitans halophyticus]|uniref:TetR family transcriptional regulator n=1 Tax=Tamaricihabitans halophyticus TaxID=1262583 RepID=A0A4R2R624_9PSEU|nr:TetR/AcrR family transcriptional regulator [Tamaricihabitans halophyticus]TCP57289.1 TetR family transcriptional regulator [Tamaricihabitans halophyticus]
MSDQSTSRRQYRSSLRAAQASRTRAAITGAARELFETSGFAGTTIAQIAKHAGVATQTVYAAFGSKAKVARAIVEQMEESADAALWRERIAAEDDPQRILRAFAEWTGAFFSASMPQLLMAREVAAEMEEMAAEGNARRRAGLTALIQRIATTGAIRRGLSEVEAVDRAWILTGLDTYLNATSGCGWPPASYVNWLADMLVQQLLEPDSAQN